MEVAFDDLAVDCPFHIPSGHVEAPPCQVPVRTYVVSVVDGQVCIEVRA